MDAWKSGREAQIVRLQQQRAGQFVKECTFRPKTNIGSSGAHPKSPPLSKRAEEIAIIQARTSGDASSVPLQSQGPDSMTLHRAYLRGWRELLPSTSLPIVYVQCI